MTRSSSSTARSAVEPRTLSGIDRPPGRAGRWVNEGERVRGADPAQRAPKKRPESASPPAGARAPIRRTSRLSDSTLVSHVEFQSGAQLRPEPRRDLGDIVFAHALDPVANVGCGQTAKDVKLITSLCFSDSSAMTSSMMILAPPRRLRCRRTAPRPRPDRRRCGRSEAASPAGGALGAGTSRPRPGRRSCAASF